MIFSSLDFLIFLLIVIGYIKYFENKSETNKKTFLLLASYFFYGYWDWRFLSLILIITFISYYCSNLIYSTKDNKLKKIYLSISIVSSLSILGVFKYYNFFIDSINVIMPLEASPLSTLNIILPLGISFYTFHTISYTIDIYRKEIEPATPLNYALAIVFFPQLVAGPIVRASEFIPQLKNKIIITRENILIGSSIFVIGFAKKSLLADNLAVFVDTVFENPDMFDAATLLAATIAYSLQIYFDFSGYSDMAMGVGKMLGFDFPQNFNYPYKSKNITEFWRRWHMTLSRWLRDYLYISLGGNRVGKIRIYSNLFITMTLGGLWHGASYNFIIWGILHGVALVIHKLFSTYFKPARNNPNIQIMFDDKKWHTYFSDGISILFTYLFICVTWILFRAQTFDDQLEVTMPYLTDQKLIDDLI